MIVAEHLRKTFPGKGKDKTPVVAVDPEAARRELGVLPDARGVYKRLTARENIRYFGELHGMSREAIDARTAVLAEALQMQDFLDRQTGCENLEDAFVQLIGTEEGLHA